MFTANAAYFQRASLRQRFIDDLDAALIAGLLSTTERDWLLSTARPAVEGDPDPVRVDRLLFDDTLRRPFELSAALLLSHAVTGDSRVYLYTLAHGIEPFNGRVKLLEVLGQRFAEGRPDAMFEYEHIEGDPFRAQMLEVVEAQVALVRRMTQTLNVMPALFDATTAALSQQLRHTLPDLPIDPLTHLLQVVQTASGDNPEFVLMAQTLAQAAYEDYRGVSLVEGTVRRFLDARGLILTDRDAGLLAKSLSDAVVQTQVHYSAMLKAFWSEVQVEGRTRRELVIESFNTSFRHQIYGCQHDGTLTSQEFMALRPLLHWSPGSVSTPNGVRCSRLVIESADGSHHTLAGTFVFHLAMPGDDSIWWFSPAHSLRKFAGLMSLSRFLSSPQGRKQLSPALAHEQRSLLMGKGPLNISLQAIEAGLFADRVDSVLALQHTNLGYASALSSDDDTLAAMFDDALDIRQLIDPRQLQFNAGRWSPDATFDFAEAWGTDNLDIPPVSGPAVGEGDNAQGVVTRCGARAALTPSWHEQTGIADFLASLLHEGSHALRDYARQVLQGYLCVLLANPVLAQDIHLQWLEPVSEDEPDIEASADDTFRAPLKVSSDLVSLLLERVTGHRTQPIDEHSGMQVLSSQALDVELLNRMLDQAAKGFKESWIEYFTQSLKGIQRQGKSQWQPFRVATNLRQDSARIGLALSHRVAVMPDGAFNMAQQVLDLPTRAQRAGLPEPRTEAFSISLLYGDDQVAALSDTMVLLQPQKPNSDVMLWSSVKGWRHDESITQLTSRLKYYLYGTHSEQWLELVGESDRALLRAHLRKTTDNAFGVRLDRIDGHVFETLQKGALDRQRQSLAQVYERAVRSRFEASLFLGLASATEIDHQLDAILDGLSIDISRKLFKAMLPPWLASASYSEVSTYVDIWRRYYLASEGGKNFLFSIPSLSSYAHDRLEAQLELDFPGKQFDPGLITVSARNYIVEAAMTGQVPSAIPAATIVHKESLTDYSTNRFVDFQGATLSIESDQQPDAARLLTPAYLKKMVRTLDVGAGFLAMLRQSLDAGDLHFQARQRLFVNQLPSMMQMVAYQMILEKKLSANAFKFIARLGDMPDGIAREPVSGTRVILSPLQLVADAGMAPDVCSGVYLICPQDAQKGPVVVYAPQHPDITFREFDSRDALLQTLKTDEALQDALIQRMNPEIRDRYRHGGFIEPHLQFYAASLGDVPLRAPGPVALAVTEFKGNALQLLFDDTRKLLLEAAMSYTVTTRQEDQAARRFLLTLGVEQGLSFLPGKLASLVSVWQSHSLFSASLTSASGKRWGEAVSEFFAALSLMATARGQARDELSFEEQPVEEAFAHGESERALGDEEPSYRQSWAGAHLSGEQLIRLQALEVKNVALNDLRRDDLLSLYHDPHNNATYAAVSGRIFQVKRNPEDARWMIVGAQGESGPPLRLDDNQRWKLDLSMGLRGGGGVVTRLKQEITEMDAEDSMVIEARGMTDIRSRYRDRARRIGQAHLHAKWYLENCLDNLNVHQRGTPLDPRVMAIVGEFFGVVTPGQALLLRVEQAIKTLFDSLMDASLSPFSSDRFVVGVNRAGLGNTVAFVFKDDPRKRVYLTERFFSAPPYRLNAAASTEGFDGASHYRSATLLHELSHLALDTCDIAYLESSAPYPDLIAQNNANNVQLKADIDMLQNRSLSHLTDPKSLFLMLENGRWRDITSADNRGLDAIFRITGTRSLNQARATFLADADKRSQVILKNADSLVLLILRLGRHKYTVPNP